MKTNMNYVFCPKCAGDLQHIGIAIKSNIVENVHYFGPKPFIYTETIELIPVFKCINCGFSFNGGSYDEQC